MRLHGCHTCKFGGSLACIIWPILLVSYACTYIRPTFADCFKFVILFQLFDIVTIICYCSNCLILLQFLLLFLDLQKIQQFDIITIICYCCRLSHFHKVWFFVNNADRIAEQMQ